MEDCSPEPDSQQLYYVCVHLRHQYMETKLRQLISLAEAQKALEAHGCKFSVTNLSIIPHTLGILTTKFAHCTNFLSITVNPQLSEL